MDIQKRELWDRLENEPERAYRAFECYLVLPSRKRTLLGAYRQHVSNSDAVKPSDTWSRWSSQFAWRERAAAYDDHLASVRREAHEQVIKEQAERQAREVEKTRGRFNELMTLGFMLTMEALEDEDWVRDNLRASDVIKIIGLHMDAVKAFGVDREPTCEDDWNEEDLAEFDDFTIDIDELEEIQEENPEEGSGEEDSESDHPDESG
jgi:hypothetical protein